jgi:hypothetical protein
MDVEVEASLLARRGLTREQVGWLGEQDLDRAILLGSLGRDHPYLIAGGSTAPTPGMASGNPGSSRLRSTTGARSVVVAKLVGD